MEIVRAGPLQELFTPPSGFSVLRIRGTGAHETQIAKSFMQAAADDDDGGVPGRLANGDELFGWRSAEGAIACFSWLRYRHRAVGPVALKDHPGRIFLYNAHTLPPFRGRGLFSALLLLMRSTLTQEGHREFIGDVDRRNTASRHSLDRAGFQVVGSITFVTLFQRWERELSRTMVDRSMAPLF
jgi:ribosomal protein S18 acetylase RimI-like enzyme